VSAVSAPRASVWLLAATITALAIFALDVLFGVLPSGLSELSDRFAIPVVFFGAAVPCALRAREAREEASAWWLFSLALVLWGTGSLYYGYALWQGRQIPTPSPADGFWIVFYLPAYAALFKLLRSRAGTAPRNLWLDALVGALGVVSAGAAVAIQSILAHTPDTVPALDTERLLESCKDQVAISTINTGYAKRRPAPRGLGTFVSLDDFQPVRGRQVAEVTVEHGIEDIAKLTIAVELAEKRGPSRLWPDEP